jgi:NTE family protein
VFAIAGAGTSFDGHPIPTHQYQLGRPLRLGAYNLGEIRGDHYLQLTLGYLRGIGRLPDFVGGPIMAGGWFENGSAFDDWDTAELKTNVGVGLIADTLFGPAILGTSVSVNDGSWRYYVGLGRVFR